MDGGSSEFDYYTSTGWGFAVMGRIDLTSEQHDALYDTDLYGVLEADGDDEAVDLFEAFSPVFDDERLRVGVAGAVHEDGDPEKPIVGYVLAHSALTWRDTIILDEEIKDRKAQREAIDGAGTKAQQRQAKRVEQRRLRRQAARQADRRERRREKRQEQRIKDRLEAEAPADDVG